MKCPKCKTGILVLFSTIEVDRKFKVARDGKIYKTPRNKNEHETEKNYLECENMSCNQYFYYELDKSGKISKESLCEY